jgi:hypothetical protein
MNNTNQEARDDPWDRSSHRINAKGEETLLGSSNPKGLDKAKKRAKVTIKFTEKDDQPKVTQISFQAGKNVEKTAASGNDQQAPR